MGSGLRLVDRSPKGHNVAMALTVAVGAGEVQLWFEASEDVSEAAQRSYHSWLTPPEVDQMERFCFENDRLAYLCGRGLARRALSGAVPAVHPAAWTFDLTRHGRPTIASPVAARPLDFNLTHADGMVACAVSLSRCGIDIESTTRPLPVDVLARSFAPEEVRDVLSAPETDSATRFFRYWTLKEAYAKAIGLGILLPFDGLVFRFPDGGSPVLAAAPLNSPAGHWCFGQWIIRDHHVVSVAVRASKSRVRFVFKHAELTSSCRTRRRRS